jgi:hypothetical protein
MRRFSAAIALLAVAAGCSMSNDPDAFAVHFTNDLGRPVVLALCKSAHSAKCEHPDYRNSVKAGESLGENISPDVRTEWAVETPDGQLLRCVNLYWRHYPGSDQTFRLSAAPRWADPCPISN